MNRGFTVVEVLVTIVIMAILMGLGTVGLRATLANGRDAERKSDIETIARALEQRYDRGNLKNPTTYPKSTYPSSAEYWMGPMYFGEHSDADILPGITEAALVSPSGLRYQQFCVLYPWNGDCDVVEKQSNLEAIFENPDGSIKDIYLYEFVGPNNGYCDWADCVRYNLYWISEVDQTVYKGIPGLKVHRSKHS